MSKYLLKKQLDFNSKKNYNLRRNKIGNRKC